MKDRKGARLGERAGLLTTSLAFVVCAGVSRAATNSIPLVNNPVFPDSVAPGGPSSPWQKQAFSR